MPSYDVASVMYSALAPGHLPFHNQTIRTPTGEPYNGVAFSKKICGVSIIRSGSGPADLARHVIACRLTRQTRVYNAWR